MNTFLNIKKVSLIFFIAIGIIHLGSSMLIANNLFPQISYIINKTMEIPFILTGMIYGLSSLRISFSNQENPHKVLDISLISLIIIVLIALVVINLAVPTNI
ncbi:hypothetical protein M0P48_04480 [Candidatus Gracilibacteria bacterium]|jgi:hypothetical protein|nr:hypothetical protein [Candidatus Gracilibacteria bacterium]